MNEVFNSPLKVSLLNSHIYNTACYNGSFSKLFADLQEVASSVSLGRVKGRVELLSPQPHTETQLWGVSLHRGSELKRFTLDMTGLQPFTSHTNYIASLENKTWITSGKK